MHKKLFIPGPTEVRPEILEAMATPMIGHRSSAYATLQAECESKVKKLLFTEGRVFLFTSSSTGVMEGAIRNCVGQKVLNTMNGEFSRRWHEIARSCGVQAEKLEVEPGQAITPELVDAALSQGGYDAVCLTHNETSTGIMNPVREIAALVRAKYPDVLILVDAVSSMAGVEIRFDEWGLDVCLAGVQKCFALPPGLAVCGVSGRAMERAKTIPHRGYYFDFLEMEKFAQKNNTPATPSISHLYALNKQMDCILAEGVENRFTRHIAMAEYTRAWARQVLLHVRRRTLPLHHRQQHQQYAWHIRFRFEQGPGRTRGTDFRRLRTLQGQVLPHRTYGRSHSGRCKMADRGN